MIFKFFERGRERKLGIHMVTLKNISTIKIQNLQKNSNHNDYILMNKSHKTAQC